MDDIDMEDSDMDYDDDYEYADYHDILFVDDIYENTSCACGSIWCGNIAGMKEFESLTHATKEEEEKMHEALKSQDCGQVCQLLQSGMRLCCNGDDNCFVNILKFCRFPFIRSALEYNPSAINCRGPGGNTLLMLSDSIEKLKVVMRYGPDLTAVNDEGDNWLHHAMKHRLHDTSKKAKKLSAEHDRAFDGHFLWSDEVKSLLKKSKAMIEFIVKYAVDVNSVDAKGETALQVVLKLFKCGYVLNQFHHTFDQFRSDHDQELCVIDNEIASYALSQLLKANAMIPPPDDFGRTVLMMAALSPWNTDNMMLLIKRGVDVAAKDQNGFNAIFYLLSSFAQHYHWNCQLSLIIRSSHIDKMTSVLLKMGCEMQGTDIIMFENEFDTSNDARVKAITHLLSLKDSELNQCDFPQKLALKNDTENYTFLEAFFHCHRYEDHMVYYPWHFEANDVALIEKELSEGLKVVQRRPTSEKSTGDIDEERRLEKWSTKLCIPNAIESLMHSLLQTIYVPDEFGIVHLENPVSALVPVENYYQIGEDIQRLLLPFWPHPPLALVLVCWYNERLRGPHVILRKRLLEFLFDMGGPLSPGSELYIAVKNTFELAAQKAPLFAEVLDLFRTLHLEVPTLQQLARTALRGSFKFDRTDTVGLDLSSLRVQWQGRMLVLPQLIKNFINFKPLLYKPISKASV